ncbi:MAG TPA: hypothetical protein VG939_03235, partial [Caulobacteraceae bacterium]|nr:hypothetical protein [Caulobacteraceae bacterium]
TCLVAPNSLHHVWLADWAALYPEAAVFVAPGLEKKVPGALAARARTLDDHPPAEWAEVIDQAAVLGDILNEICFFHRPSRTLVLTDLIENFEACRVCARWRWVVKLAGAADPHGSAPHDMRASFARRRGPLRAAVQRMIGWSPERVILAHGRWYDRDGTRELQRAFRWAL